jgi:hypothetical protein
VPSSRVPTAIPTGPGRLPSSIAAGAQAPSTVVFDEDVTSVQLITSDHTVTRVGPHQTLLVDTSGGTVDVTFPNNARLIFSPGDTVQVIDVAGNAHVSPIDLRANSTTNIAGLSGAVGSIFDRYGSATLVFSGEQLWSLVSKTGPFDVSVTASNTLFRRGPVQRVFVLTSNGSWVSGTSAVSLPSSPSKGDVVTIIDADGGSNKQIIINGNGSSIDTDLTQFVMTGDNSSVTLVYNTFSTGTLGWTLLVKPTPYVLNTSLAMTLARVSSQMRVAVLTSAGSWVAGHVITLPTASSCYLGDTITVYDSGGQASTKSIVVNPNGSTINGAATYTISANGGSVTFLRSTGDWTIQASTEVIPFEQIVTNALTLTRRSAVMRVLVQTANGAWSGDTLTLPASPLPGDLITVVDVDGTSATTIAKAIIVSGNGNNISGRSTYTINSNHGFVSMVFASAGGWFITSRDSSNYVQVVAATVVLTREDRVMLIEVQSGAPVVTVTLPATPVRGDIITIVDIGAAAVNNFTIEGNGNNINGSASLLVNTNRKSVTMTFNTSWFIIGAGP